MSNLKTFYILTVTQTLSLIGSRMTSIAVGIWVFAATGLTSPLLFAAFFAELPGVVGSSLAGVLVDRWDRRRVILLADAGQACGSLLLLASFTSGRFQVWHLYLVALLQGSFAILQQPAKEAAITMLIPSGHRERANAVQQMAFPLAGVVAPVVAGILYLLISIRGIILIDLATFLVAAGVIYFMRIPHPKQTEEGLASRGSVSQELLASFRFLSRRPALLGLVLYGVAINFLLNGPLELAVPYLITVTGSEAQMGAIMGVFSLGAFTGASLIAVWGGTRPRIHTMLPGMLLTGIMFLLYGVARSPLALGLALFFLIIPLPASSALFISIMQLKTPPDMQGRIFGSIAQMEFLGATLSFLLVGPLVDYVLEPAVGRPGWQIISPLVGNQPGAGIGLLLIVTGLIILMITLFVYASPHIRRLEASLPDYQALSETEA